MVGGVKSGSFLGIVTVELAAFAEDGFSVGHKRKESNMAAECST